MLKELILNVTDYILDFAWNIESNLESFSFPLHINKNELKASLERSINSEENKVLLAYKNDALVGVLNLMVLKEDMYLQSLGMYISLKEYSEVFHEFFQYIKCRYQGYEMFIGLAKENTTASGIMNDIGAQLVESSTVLLLNREDFIAYPSKIKVEHIRDTNFQLFASFHDYHNPDMYWKSERIREKMNLWKIYGILVENKIVASILYNIRNKNLAEIVALTVNEKVDYWIDILSKTIPEIFSTNENILYFVEDDNPQEFDSAIRLGFKIIAHYQCFKIKI